MSDDISKVIAELRDSCDTVGCGGRHGYCDKCTWADRLESATTEKSVAMRYLEEKQADTMKQFHENYTESATTPAEVGPESFDFGGVSYVRATDHQQRIATLARQLAEAKDTARSYIEGAKLDALTRADMQKESRLLQSQLAEATRRLGEVEGLLRECQRRLGAEESLRHMTYREWSELDDRIDAALTKEPTK